jgi:hypothetical protein
MIANEAQRVMRVRTAIAALLASGAMTLLGPVSIAVAAPVGDNVDGARSVEAGSHSRLPALGQIRAVVRHSRSELRELSEMESLRLKMTVDRTGKALSTVSNILKKQSQGIGRILGNLK